MSPDESRQRLTTVKAVAAAAALGLWLGGAAACSTASRCEGTCSGCCDDQGLCQSGQSSAACGSGGLLCTRCASTEMCLARACAPFTGAGGGTGGSLGTGGGTGGGTLDGGEIRSGGVTASSTRYLNGVQQIERASVSWAFGVVTPGVLPYECVEHLTGPCEVRACSYGGGGGPEPEVTYVSAGTITLTGGHSQVVGGTDGGVMGWWSDPSHAFFGGGETLVYSATGGDVPPFAGSLTAPTQVVLLAPWAADAGLMAAPRSQDLGVVWSGGASGQVEVSIHSPTVGNSWSSARCRFPATAGSGLIPAAALSGLFSGSNSLSAEVVVRQHHPLPADWEVTVEARTNAVDSRGGFYFQKIDLQ